MSMYTDTWSYLPACSQDVAAVPSFLTLLPSRYSAHVKTKGSARVCVVCVWVSVDPGLELSAPALLITATGLVQDIVCPIVRCPCVLCFPPMIPLLLPTHVYSPPPGGPRIDMASCPSQPCWLSWASQDTAASVLQAHCSRRNASEVRLRPRACEVSVWFSVSRLSDLSRRHQHPGCAIRCVGGCSRMHSCQPHPPCLALRACRCLSRVFFLF